MAKPTQISRFRKAHEAQIHKLMPWATAYLSAAQDGEPLGCEEALNEMAKIVMGIIGRDADNAEPVLPKVTPLRAVE